MISHKYKCIFIHIPKCAGTSLENVLGHYNSYSGRRGQDHRTLRQIEPVTTINAFTSKENRKELAHKIRYKYRKNINPKNKEIVNKRQYKTYFKFTIVRNPWARVYSWYKNVLRDEIHKQHYGITREISLIDFLKKYAGFENLRTQMLWIKDFNGSVPLDFIGRFENLTDDFKEIARLRKTPNFSFPHKQKGSGEDYKMHFDPESIEFVSNYYREEIEYFKYSFGD